MNRTLKWIAGLLSLILLVCGMPVAASDNTVVPDLSHRGTISIEFRDSETNEPFSYGTKVGLFKVADVIENKGYSFVYDELFESVGSVPATVSEYTSDLAYRLKETAEYKGISLDAPSELISEDGKVVFKNLEPGLYLIVQTHRGTDSLRYQIEPFLVTVPVRQGRGVLIYDPSLTYKTGTGEIGTAEVELNGATMIDNAQMEVAPQNENMKWIIVAIGIVAVALVVLSVSRRAAVL